MVIEERGYFKRRFQMDESKARRFLARLGVLTLCHPPEEARGKDWIKNFVMIYHYCPNCKDYRYDTHYDYLSKNEHFRCGGCNVRFNTRGLYGGVLYYYFQCALVAREQLEEKYGDKEIPSRLRKAAYNFYVIAGINKYTPDDRGGRTTGELEIEAMGKWMNLLETVMMNMQGMR